jgi:hypothetical protein
MTVSLNSFRVCEQLHSGQLYFSKSHSKVTIRESTYPLASGRVCQTIAECGYDPDKA